MKQTKSFVADFETVVTGENKNQTETDVWLAGYTEIGNLNPDNVYVFQSLDDFMRSFKRNGLLRYGQVNMYFHNLRFDGSFILNWLLKNKTHAVYTEKDSDEKETYFFKNPKDMLSSEFIYMVSERGIFYNIKYKIGHTMINFLDSAKLLPMKLRVIGEEFDTTHKKLDMEYKGYRYPGCKIKPHELEYFKNDLLLPSEALDLFINKEGHTKPTIGSNCLSEFQFLIGGKKEFYKFFPKLEDIELENGMNADEYCRPSYRGAFCICFREGYKQNGVTLDVNSEYPFVMDTFKLPYGEPVLVKDKKIETSENTYIFVRFKCDFKLKDGMLPCIQIKNKAIYKGNEWLKTSFLYDENKNEYVNEYTIGEDVFKTRQELVLCETDYFLFLEHYEVFEFEIIDYVAFPASRQMFKEYVGKYYQLKSLSEGGKRVIYKLFLNNLYGKLGTNNNGSFKIARLEDDTLKWKIQSSFDKPTYHVAVASAIIAGGRKYVIEHAQMNYEHFCYADTDSLHLDCPVEDVVGIEIDKKKLGAWDLELEWDEANFVRQKTYVERDGQDISIACCSMGEVAQKNVKYAIRTYYADTQEEYDKIENDINKDVDKKNLDLDFIRHGMSLTDFTHGLKVNGNLKQKQIKGGCLLYEDSFEMK